MRHLNYGVALLLQLLLMWSVYVIYFQTTVMTGLKPQKSSMKSAPANRLVIFLVDGLSAKSFFENDCGNVPQLQEILLQQGQVGISITRRPSKCRPGHVALFAGFYEDPAAAIYGWSRNAMTFDTLFNRSTVSYGWGSAELLQHFPAVHKLNVHNNDIAGFYEDSYKLDEWAFHGVHMFLNNKARKIKNNKGLVFFVQLLGLHRSNGSQAYRDNLNYTQHGIWTTYERFEQSFPDQRTAYLLISDHGMRNGGYHGGSSKEEVETPFLVWGAGVSNSNISQGRSFVANTQKTRRPLHVLQQTQLTPLMSALLGLPTPVNNRGQLITGLLNASNGYESHAMFLNALQLVEQSMQLLQHHGRGQLANFMPGNWMSMQQLDSFVYTGNLLWLQQRYLTLTEYSANFMPSLLQCIDYYQHYYQRAMRLFTACAFLGWQHYIRTQLASCSQTASRRSLWLLVALVFVGLFPFVLLAFVSLQSVPWLISGVLLLPGVFWTLALKAHEGRNMGGHVRQLLWQLMFLLCCIAGFFDRRLIAVCYFIFGCVNNRRAFVERTPKFYGWLLLLCILTSLSSLPPSMGNCQRSLLIVSMLLNFVRPILRQGIHRQNLICNGVVLLVASMYILHSRVPWMMHLIARAYLCYVFYPRFGEQGIESIIFNLSTLYTLLCTSYEALVIQLLAMELELALHLKIEHVETGNFHRQQALAMYMLLYSFYSFFVIGNIEAVDRFRFYMRFTGFGVYSALINAFVIALKLLLPMLLLICIIRAKYEIVWANRRRIFYKLLIMCNRMAIVFLFRVRNDGSWWEIGVSIAHFVSVQILPFVLLLLCYLAHFMLVDSTKDPLELPKWNVQ